MTKECSFADCARLAVTRGWCRLHYHRWKTHGDPGTCLRGQRKAWLLKHQDYSDESCLIWPFIGERRGYGAAYWGGRSTSASRIMCILAHGNPAHNKLEAAHSCGNRKCCNPRHLRWATSSENKADQLEHGTRACGERHKFAKLTADNVRQIRASKLIHHCVLAVQYNVRRETIGKVMRRVSWKHI